ncbi:unnamed protein product [Meganyctiphanes norvegica]|uniref:RanBP2-type domain-containing protein n=1 Tax=Meganyctiphanes norvegica TaxID=48144 RepID=A0AAV2RFH5_MEGNR
MFVFAKQVVIAKMEQKIIKGMEEKAFLKIRVEELKRELDGRTNQRKKNADNYASQIYNLERENERLQSECDQMEREILNSLTGNVDSGDFINKTILNSPECVRQNFMSQQANLSRMSSSSSIGSSSGTQFIRMSSSSSVGSACGITTSSTPKYLSPSFQASPPVYTNANSFNAQNEVEDEQGKSWSCSQCTFLNHAELTRCEICDYQRQPGEC